MNLISRSTGPFTFNANVSFFSIDVLSLNIDAFFSAAGGPPRADPPSFNNNMADVEEDGEKWILL